MFSTNQNGNLNLVLLDVQYPSRVRSHITSVVYQIQWFDFDCNLVVKRKVIIRAARLCVQALYIIVAHMSPLVRTAFGLDRFKTTLAFDI